MAARLFLQPANRKFFLPDSIRVVQQVLVLYVLVRIQVRQHGLFLQLFFSKNESCFGSFFFFIHGYLFNYDLFLLYFFVVEVRPIRF